MSSLFTSKKVKDYFEEYGSTEFEQRLYKGDFNYKGYNFKTKFDESCIYFSHSIKNGTDEMIIESAFEDSFRNYFIGLLPKKYNAKKDNKVYDLVSRNVDNIISAFDGVIDNDEFKRLFSQYSKETLSAVSSYIIDCLSKNRVPFKSPSLQDRKFLKTDLEYLVGVQVLER